MTGGMRPDNYRFPQGLPGAVSQPLAPVAPAIPYGFEVRSNVARLSNGIRVELRQSTVASPQFATVLEHESPEYRTALVQAREGDAFEISVAQRVDGATLEWGAITVNSVGIAVPLPAGYALVRARCTFGSTGGVGVVSGIIAAGIPNTIEYAQTFGLAVAPATLTIPPFASSVFVEAPTGQIVTVSNGVTSWQAQPGSPIRVGLQGFTQIFASVNVPFSFCPFLWRVRR